MHVIARWRRILSLGGKIRATRQARGTTSRKKKLAIKGDMTGVTIITPVTSPAPAPSPSAQPASNASSAPHPGELTK
jgi:hypothetical protein